MGEGDVGVAGDRDPLVVVASMWLPAVTLAAAAVDRRAGGSIRPLAWRDLRATAVSRCALRQVYALSNQVTDGQSLW
jgi:hypothetical protein